MSRIGKQPIAVPSGVTVNAQGVTFTPDASGARLLRERSKQTLLDFADAPEDAP